MNRIFGFKLFLSVYAGLLLLGAPLISYGQVTSQPVIIQSETKTQTLHDIYQAKREQTKFTSVNYLFRVFGVLTGLLIVFYITAKWLAHTQALPSASNNKKGLASFLRKLPNISPLETLRPKVLLKTPLAAGRELHVVEIQNRLLLIGSTAQQITLLTELNAPSVETTETTKPDISEDMIYQKYLTEPAKDG